MTLLARLCATDPSEAARYGHLPPPRRDYLFVDVSWLAPIDAGWQWRTDDKIAAPWWIQKNIAAAFGVSDNDVEYEWPPWRRWRSMQNGSATYDPCLRFGVCTCDANRQLATLVAARRTGAR